jgi:hypothetical protein
LLSEPQVPFFVGAKGLQPKSSKQCAEFGPVPPRLLLPLPHACAIREHGKWSDNGAKIPEKFGTLLKEYRFL